MYIYFNIIGIKKYVIKKIIYITSVTQFHWLVISNDLLLRLRHQRPEINRKHVKNSIFSEISSLTSKTISLLIHYAM